MSSLLQRTQVNRTVLRKKNPESKKLLSDFRKDPVRMNALIRRCRIRENPDELGVDTEHERRKEFLEARTTMEQYADVHDKAEAKWCTENRFIAHQIFHEGIEGDTLKECRENARELWKEESKKVDVKKRTRGGNMEVAVDTAPSIVALRGRKHAKAVDSTEGLHTEAQLQNALVDLAAHGTSSTAFTGSSMGGLGDVFQPGKAVCDDPSRSNAPMPVTLGCAPMNTVTDPDEKFKVALGFSGDWPSTGQGTKRGVKRTKTDDGTEYADGVTGDVLEMREQGAETVKTALTDYGGRGEKNKAKSILVLMRGEDSQIPEAEHEKYAAMAEKYTALLAKLKSHWAGNVKKWVRSTMHGLNAHLQEEVAELERLHGELSPIVDKAQEELKQERKKAATTKRKESTVRNKSLISFKVAGDTTFPMAVVKHMYDKGLLLSAICTGTSAKPVHLLDEAGSDLDERTATVIRHVIPGTGQAMAQLQKAIGVKRIHEMVKIAHNKINGNTNTAMCNIRLTPLGSGADRTEELDWVPSAWKTRQLTPSGLRGLGTP